MAYLFFGIFIGALLFGGSESAPGPSLLTEMDSYSVLGACGVGAVFAGVLIWGVFPHGTLILFAAGLTALGGAVGYWFGDPGIGFGMGMLLAVLGFVAVFVLAHVMVRREDRELAKRMEERRLGGTIEDVSEPRP